MRERLAGSAPIYHTDTCATRAEELDETFVDTTTGTPYFFTYGGMVCATPLLGARCMSSPVRARVGQRHQSVDAWRGAVRPEGRADNGAVIRESLSLTGATCLRISITHYHPTRDMMQRPRRHR